MQVPPPPHPLMLPVFATVTYLAALIATWGFTSLLLDVDVVTDPDASRLIGPAMAGAATVVVFLAVRRVAERASPWVAAAGASTGAYIGIIATAGIGRFLDAADAATGIVFAGTFAASPFALLPALLAGVTVIVTWALRPQRRAFDRVPQRD